MRVGVLALQGGYAEHKELLARVGVHPTPVKSIQTLAEIDALVIPGGESTTISLLAERNGLMGPIRDLIRTGFPVLGTCAGMIMLANRVRNGRDDRPPFGGLDMTVERNAFGRQRDSFEIGLTIARVTGPEFPAVFIRAPIVTDVGPDVEVLARLPQDARDGGAIVAVRHQRQMAVAFHPELTSDTRVHELFVQIAKGDMTE